MTYKELIKKTKTFLIGLGVAGIAGAVVLTGCMGNTKVEYDQEAGGTAVTVSQGIGERSGNEAGGEHPGGSEGTGSEGAEGSGTGGGSEEATANQLAPDQTFDMVRSGARLIMNYDPATNSFNGTVENTTNGTLTRVRIEIHLSNGTELGPTTPIDLAPGQSAPITLASTQASFNGWIAHAEVGNAEGGGSEGGNEGSGGEGPEGAGAGGAQGEEGSAAKLAPDETFDAIRGGARLIMNYDAASNSFKGTVENTTNGTLTRVRIEIHLSNGTELGPTTPIDMAPGQTVAITLPSTPQPFTGWIAHAEVGGGEGGGEHGATGAGGAGEGSGSEHGSGSRESGGEHGGGRESGGEHGGRGEGRGGG